MGSPNPLPQKYVCQTCGAPRPPYQFYCDRHQKDHAQYDKPTLIDRLMNWMLGHSRNR